MIMLLVRMIIYCSELPVLKTYIYVQLLYFLIGTVPHTWHAWLASKTLNDDTKYGT